MTKKQFLKDTKLTLDYISEINTKKLTKIERKELESELLTLWNTIYTNCKDINKRYKKN